MYCWLAFHLILLYCHCFTYSRVLWKPFEITSYSWKTKRHLEQKRKIFQNRGMATPNITHFTIFRHVSRYFKIMTVLWKNYVRGQLWSQKKALEQPNRTMDKKSNKYSRSLYIWAILEMVCPIKHCILCEPQQKYIKPSEDHYILYNSTLKSNWPY